jgi:hypothetical protein
LTISPAQTELSVIQKLEAKLRLEFPLFFPFFKVSEKTKVVRGTGDKPAARPTMIPKRRDSTTIVQ